MSGEDITFPWWMVGSIAITADSMGMSEEGLAVARRGVAEDFNRQYPELAKLIGAAIAATSKRRRGRKQYDMG